MAGWRTAACAAVMACGVAGGVQRAEAAYLVDARFGAISDADGGTGLVFLNVTLNTHTLSTTYSYDFYLDSDEVGVADFHEHHSGFIGSSSVYARTVDASDFTPPNSGITGQFFEFGDTFDNFEIYGYEKVDPFTGNAYYPYVYGGFIRFDTRIGTLVDVSGPTRFSYTEISDIPLPATAPMLGSALLALGALGYASRRSRALGR